MPALEIVVTLLLAAGQHPPLKHPTLLDQARERGGIERHSIGCGWAGRPALERLLRGPDVVIHGTILRAEGQLSDDEQEVWTRYTVLPIKVLRDRTPDSQLTRWTEPPIFLSQGGTVIVEGMTITHVVRGTGALETPLKENEEVILSGSLVDDHVRVDPLTTFRIENGHVMMNAKLDDVPAASLPLPEFAARVNGHP